MVNVGTCSASRSLNEIGVLTIKIMVFFFLREEECLTKYYYNNTNNNNNNLLTCCFRSAVAIYKTCAM